MSRSIRDFLLPKVFGLFLIFLLGMPLWLILESYFSDPPAKKIYPSEGMFTDMNKTYHLDCYISWGRDQIDEEYKLSFDRNNNVTFYEDIGIFRTYWSDYEVTKIHENTEAYLIFSLKGDDNWYTLRKDEGDFGASIGNTGSCIEEGWRWYFNEDNNTLTYERDRELMK